MQLCFRIDYLPVFFFSLEYIMIYMNFLYLPDIIYSEVKPGVIKPAG